MINKHKMLKREDNTISFVEIDHEDYLYADDLDSGGVEEEFDITFGIKERNALKPEIDNKKVSVYQYRGSARSWRGTELEGFDNVVKVMQTRRYEAEDSVMSGNLSRYMRLIFMNHLVINWAKKEEESGKRYRGQEGFRAPYEHSFGGLRSLENNGYRDSSESITVGLDVIKRNGQIERYQARDVITNVWEDGRLCSWSSRSDNFTEGRDENMYTPVAMNRYYETMNQGVFNGDLAGSNKIRVRKGDLEVVFEDYLDNYLRRLPESVRREEAISFVEYVLGKIRERGSLEGSVHVATSELATISMFSDRFYMEFIR